MKLSIIDGTYGSAKTPCKVLTCETAHGDTWYCAEGSVNVNCTTSELIYDGVDIETLADHDMFTACEPVNDLYQLENLVNEG